MVSRGITTMYRGPDIAFVPYIYEDKNMHTRIILRRKTVRVRAYVRTRFGNREHVCAHWRSHPGQLTLF